MSFSSGFIPGAGQQYDVIAAPLVGQFQSYTAPTISPYISIDAVYQPNLVRLVTTDPTPRVVGKPAFDPQNRLVLNIQGIVNQFYGVEASTNLADWAGLATNAIQAGTIWRFVDADSATMPYRFYRVMFLP